MDHYSVIGLNANATKPKIKEAFKKLAMKFHPDKHTESSKSVQSHAISKFKRVSETYEVLTDVLKRADSRCGFGGRGGNRGGVGSTSGSTSPFYGVEVVILMRLKKGVEIGIDTGSNSSSIGGGFDAVMGFLSSLVVLISIAFARFGMWIAYLYAFVIFSVFHLMAFCVTC